MIDSNIQQDVLQACVIKDVTLPKQYAKIQYCVSCAIHNHLVHVRSAEERKPHPVTLDRFKRVATKKVEKKPVVEAKKVEEPVKQQ